MKSSPFLQEVSQKYTLPLFDLFQKEYDKHSAAYIKQIDEDEVSHEYIVGMFSGDEEYKVSYSHSLSTIACSCRK